MDITEKVKKLLYIDSGCYIKYYYRKCFTNDLPLEINKKQKLCSHQYSFLHNGIDSGLNFKYRKDFSINDILIYSNDIIMILVNEILDIIFNEGPEFKPQVQRKPDKVF